MIPPTVFKEAVTIGLERGFEDAKITSLAIEQGLIEVRNPTEESLYNVRTAASNLGIELGFGEIEAIALASSMALLIDDESGYLIAKEMGIKTGGTLSFLTNMVSRKLISKKEAIEALNIMIEKGFWLSPKIVNLFHQKLNEL